MENTNQFIVIKKVLVSMSGGEQILLYPVKTDEVTWIAQDERISARFTRKAIKNTGASPDGHLHFPECRMKHRHFCGSMEKVGMVSFCLSAENNIKQFLMVTGCGS